MENKDLDERISCSVQMQLIRGREGRLAFLFLFLSHSLSPIAVSLPIFPFLKQYQNSMQIVWKNNETQNHTSPKLDMLRGSSG